MRVRFWGTRGSIPKPGQSTLRYGGNTSCVEVQTADGTCIVLDCGTGAHGLGKAIVENKKKTGGHLLISHTHWDHIQGFPFFAPLRNPSGEWDVYGPRGLGSSLRETLAGQMNYTYFPVELTGLDAHVRYHELVEGSFELGDVHVEAHYLNHPAVTLGYRLEADGVVVVYATDHEPHSRQLAMGEAATGFTREDDAHAAFLQGADLVIHDTQYTAAEYPNHVGWGHSTVEYVVDRTRDKGISRLALFHHDPMRDDDGVDRLVNFAKERFAPASERIDVLGAAEGMTLELEPRPVRSRARSGEGSARRTPAREAASQKLVMCAREADNIEVFRHAAAADRLPLLETDNLEGAITLTKESSPSVVIFEKNILGADCTDEVQRVREAVPADDSQPVMLGLVSQTGESLTKPRTESGVEWVETPVTAQYARTRLRSCLLRTACRWRPSSVPSGEDQRIKALHDLGILDTPNEERFDRYTRLAAALFRVPTALVSLVDRDRQWFKSRYGLDAEETPRDQAFCAHAILDSEVFEISDAREHPDFADNPLVTGPPYLRFYAGIPLTLAGGERIGTLCLIDYFPRELDEKEKALLKDLGRLVEKEIESAQPR